MTIDYQKIKVEGFDLEVEVGVIPPGLVTTFLEGLKVNSTLSKTDYEEFLLAALVKGFFNELLDFVTALDSEQDRKMLRHGLLENIYRLNTKLNPKHVVIYNKQLRHRMDSIRGGGPSEPVLTMNPGWRDYGKGDLNLNQEPVRKLLNEIWEDLKKHSGYDYHLAKINVLDMEIPILDISSMALDMDRFIMEFILKKCEGNIFIARHDNRLWIGYVLAFAVPRIEELIYELAHCNYMASFTENVIYTQMYLAVIKYNPMLNYESINWDAFDTGEDAAIPEVSTPQDRVRKASGRTPAKSRRSSKEEAEAEKPRFRDVSYEKILGLGAEIKKRIIGQDKAVNSISEAIAVARVGLRGANKPIGAFLFAGKTGVGKTELAKVVADNLTEHECITVACVEYQQAHEISKIFGSPPGYVGFEDESRNPHASTPPTTVASKLKENPFSVVLFDEIEKADPAIYNVLLQIMDEGKVTSGRGETISFSDAVIILTSNVGTAEAEELCLLNRMGFGEDGRDKCSLAEVAIQEAIRERFKPEFRNRLSETVIFNSLSKADCKDIIDVLLNKTKINLEKAQELTMVWDGAVKEHILAEGFSEEFGAREIERVISKKIEVPLANYILQKYILKKGDKHKDVISISVNKKQIHFKSSALIEQGARSKGAMI